jgi:hypothetical protein
MKLWHWSVNWIKYYIWAYITHSHTRVSFGILKYIISLNLTHVCVCSVGTNSEMLCCSCVYSFRVVEWEATDISLIYWGGGGKIFLFSPNRPQSFGAHVASYSMGIWSYFPGIKHPEREVEYLSHSSVKDKYEWNYRPTIFFWFLYRALLNI